MITQDYFEQKKELSDKQKFENTFMPTIDSLHDDNGSPTFDMGDGHLDCRYPVFEPHLILVEMQKILLEVRQIRDSLGFFGIDNIGEGTLR